MQLHEFQQQLHAQFDEIVANRRHMHQYPELSFHEEKTATFICETLEKYAIAYEKNVGKLGVVATIYGQPGGKTLAFRADFDALPITDEKDCAYKSTIDGVMHACGHDGHTASLLAFANVLQQNRASFKGTIKCIFQPAEEKPPGGAKFMVEAGVLQDVDAVYGAHLASDLPFGTVSTAVGPVMASVDAFKITFIGQGGHAGHPHKTKDSIIAASQFVQTVQQIVSRRINPLEPAVVSIGSIHAGNAFNVIADQAVIEGTVRALHRDVRAQIEQELRAFLQALTVSHYIDYTLEFERGYPVLINPALQTEHVISILKAQFGADHFEYKVPSMGAEDFAYYLQECPGTFIYVGSNDGTADTMYPHHHPKFNFDERAMLHIASSFLAIVHSYQ